MESRATQLLDAAENAARRALAAAARPRVHAALVALVVLLGLAVRLALVPDAHDVERGHGDSWVFFNQVYADWLEGDVYPDAHRGSGWQILLSTVLLAFGVEGGGAWTAYGADVAGEALRAAVLAHALSAILAAAVVPATYLLARELLSRNGALLAALLLALDPFHLSLTTSAMSEPAYVPVLALALWTVLRARRHPAWLLATGALMALAHALRVNGLVMLAMALAFAALLLRGLPRRARAAWIAAAVATFLLVAAPYLAWRADHLPGAFDYGTNQRFWADELWDLDDAYWSAYTVAEGGPRETIRDYFATHTLGDALVRLWESVQWQAFDLFGVGKWPPLEPEGGRWVGTRPDGAALTPLVVALSLVGALTTLRRGREWWFVPLALAFTVATFVWIYPLVRSVRYFSPLVPLFTLLAIAGWSHLAAGLERRCLVGVALFGTHLALYGARVLVEAPPLLAEALGNPDVRVLALVAAAMWLALALFPYAREARAGIGRETSHAPEPTP